MDNSVPVISTTIFPEQRKRRPRLERVAAEELPRFYLTPRDRLIIQAVYEYRALTAPQIAALFFTSSEGEEGEVNTRCKHRLRMLYQHGYLFRQEQPSRLSEGRKPLVYFLDKQGAAVLNEMLETPVKWEPKDNQVSPLFLQHLLDTNAVRLAITLATKQRGWSLEKWLDDKTLKSRQMKDRVILKGPQGGTQRASVVPDGYFVLEAGEFLYHHFLEMDRRTVTGEATRWGQRDWGRKVRAYLEYYRSGQYEKRYGTQSLRLLTVTTGERRLAHLKAITAKAGGNKRFWFTTFDLATAANILTEPIWQVVDEGAPQRLIA
jgi:Replication-relaxation